MLKVNPTNGEIGIEIEVEGTYFRKPTNSDKPLPKGWMYTKDGSLRGIDNAEYILHRPIKFSEVEDHVDRLFEMFAEDKSILDESNRTSIHVHLNAQSFHMNRLCAFFALYFVVEELLTEWCGEHRVGNLFCLRGKDAPYLVKQIKNFIQSDGKWSFSDGVHYAGCNAQALQKFGSIEIRSLRGVTNPKMIIQWVRVLERIWRLSGEFQDPRNICDEFSGGGPYAFLQWVLGDTLEYVKAGIEWDQQRISESLYEGIRLAQDLCYCREWSNFTQKDLRVDPFGRTLSKVVAQLSAYEENDMMNELSLYPLHHYEPVPTTQSTEAHSPIWDNNLNNASFQPDNLATATQNFWNSVDIMVKTQNPENNEDDYATEYYDEED
jgi:hypothetical protein